jgi:hypothetical protein
VSSPVEAWLTFEGSVRPVTWGRATYTVLPLPPDVAEALERSGARRVTGEIAEHPVNLAVSRAPVVDGPFLWAGRSLLDRIGIEPGETVEVRLRPAPDDVVDTPDDIAAALFAGGVVARWEALTPGRRRGLLHRIDTARTHATRARRIAALVMELAA